MAKRKPTLITVYKQTPEHVSATLFATNHQTKRAEEYGFDLAEVDELVESIETVSDYERFAADFRQTDSGVYTVLTYPLPYLKDPKFRKEDGRPNWPAVRKMSKTLDWAVRLPLQQDSPVTFEVADAFKKLILHPDFGRKVDLEAKVSAGDALTTRRLNHPFQRALLFLNRLSLLKAREQIRELTNTDADQ
jgi:hypothetical protein